MTIPEWIKFNPQHINALSPEARIKAFAEMQSDGLALYSKVLELQGKVLELEAAHEEGAATIIRLAGENEMLKLKLHEARSLALEIVT